MEFGNSRVFGGIAKRFFEIKEMRDARRFGMDHFGRGGWWKDEKKKKGGGGTEVLLILVAFSTKSILLSFPNFFQILRSHMYLDFPFRALF